MAYSTQRINLQYRIKQVSWESHQDALRYIRSEVFIREQTVPYELEWDGLDKNCIHVLAEDDAGQPLGCARMLAGGHIGRMAVLSAFRHQRIGSAMLVDLIRQAKQKSYTYVFLNAQLQAVRFYEQHGFIISGDLFYDASIPHYRMTLLLKQDL